MCLIAYADCITKIQNLPLETIWKDNSHGAGLLTYRGNKLVASKGYMTLPSLLRKLEHIPKNTPVAIHFRLATHGSISEYNTHPFRVAKDSYLMHNGVLPALGNSGESGNSDSAHLARILSKLPHKDRKYLLESLNGRFLLASPKEISLHGSFEKHNDCHCSNTYFLPRKSLFTPGFNLSKNGKYFLNNNTGNMWHE